ncbi:MAG: helix-turn-helix transcriptional regulator [Gammaproteobacteria bacterium]|nr:helix-turn-helix transcriptional regulator [Gammaproteobacteria bacterium]
MDTKTFRKKVGHRIKVRRVELDMKQEELGAVLGVPQSQISEWEIGRRALRIEQAMDIARGLRTSVAYLVGENENRAG